jgi:hypothetical protein
VRAGFVTPAGATSGCLRAGGEKYLRKRKATYRLNPCPISCFFIVIGKGKGSKKRIIRGFGGSIKATDGVKSGVEKLAGK